SSRKFSSLGFPSGRDASTQRFAFVGILPPPCSYYSPNSSCPGLTRASRGCLRRALWPWIAGSSPAMTNIGMGMEARLHRLVGTDLHQHLAEICALEEVEECLGRILDAFFHRLFPMHLAALNEWPHLGKEFADMLEVVGNDEALNPQALANHLNDVGRAGAGRRVVILLDHAAHGDPPERTHGVDRGFQMRAADILDVHVDALWESLCHGLVEIVAGLVVDRLVDSRDFREPLALLIGTGRADHITAMRLGKLADHRANSARSGGDENRFAILQIGYLEEARPGRHARHAKHTEKRLNGAKGRVNRREARRRSGHIFAPAP